MKKSFVIKKSVIPKGGKRNSEGRKQGAKKDEIVALIWGLNKEKKEGAFFYKGSGLN